MPDNIDQRSASPILPSTTIAALLDQLPELEDVLIRIAPAFQKLKNPILRKTIARVASLEQVAQVGRIPVVDLVNQLRLAAGQTVWDSSDGVGDTSSNFAPKPEWFSSSRIVATIDEKNHDPNKMPILTILDRVASMNPGDIVELTTSFVPAPGIDLLRRKNLLVWTRQGDSPQIQTYICKPRDVQLEGTK
ncbi:MAG TPA: DUF1858 domain-containing protein [Candidatus Saccharimonadales bacterium]|jgi:hypothetical protein|nr:DUF1858 domain-containing protein [Candidatus Saccharimonadales bacterium]